MVFELRGLGISTNQKWLKANNVKNYTYTYPLGNYQRHQSRFVYNCLFSSIGESSSSNRWTLHTSFRYHTNWWMRGLPDEQHQYRNKWYDAALL